uniref:Putative ovule protein n=1 Tax=Solanum chacoense TaxID=4108 RepID=A0A0V0GKC2_SOLCH
MMKCTSLLCHSSELFSNCITASCSSPNRFKEKLFPLILTLNISLLLASLMTHDFSSNDTFKPFSSSCPTLERF